MGTDDVISSYSPSRAPSGREIASVDPTPVCLFHGGRSFRISREMAKIFLRHVAMILRDGEDQLVPIRHRDGVDLLLVSAGTPFAVSDGSRVVAHSSQEPPDDAWVVEEEDELTPEVPIEVVEPVVEVVDLVVVPEVEPDDVVPVVEVVPVVLVEVGVADEVEGDETLLVASISAHV